jgi:hypothetical protein
LGRASSPNEPLSQGELEKVSTRKEFALPLLFQASKTKKFREKSGSIVVFFRNDFDCTGLQKPQYMVVSFDRHTLFG